MSIIRRAVRLARWGAVALALQPAVAQAQSERLCWQRTDNHLCEFVMTAPQDVTGILRYPIDNPERTLGALALTGGLILLDRQLTEFHQERVEAAFSDFALPRLPWDRQLRRLGLASEDTWLLTGLAATYAYGRVTGREREQRAALLSGEAIFYSYLTTQVVLKTAFARNRPYGSLRDGPGRRDGCRTDNPFDFFNFSGVRFGPEMCGTAFPSYHFTQNFAVARVLSGLYDDSWVPYGGALALSASNIRGHRHWVSDMVAGSLLGLAIGEVVLRNSDDFRSRSIDVTPTVTRDSMGVYLSTKF